MECDWMGNIQHLCRRCRGRRGMRRGGGIVRGLGTRSGRCGGRPCRGSCHRWWRCARGSPKKSEDSYWQRWASSSPLSLPVLCSPSQRDKSGGRRVGQASGLLITIGTFLKIIPTGWFFNWMAVWSFYIFKMADQTLLFYKGVCGFAKVLGVCVITKNLRFL